MTGRAEPAALAEKATAVTGAVASAAAVANEFLELGWSEKGVPPIDQMKLQKLLFYAHAWHLAMKGGPLFDEDVEAWPWGPVVRDVYLQTKDCGRAPVVDRIWKLEVEDSDKLDVTLVEPNVESEETKEFLLEVWNSHKKFSGVQLSNSTHAPGEPWTIIRERYGSLDGKPTIPNEVIAAVFKKKLANAKVENTPA